jgi:hypothetical protein
MEPEDGIIYLRVVLNTTSITIHLLYEQRELNLLHKNIYFYFDGRNSPCLFKILFYLFAVCFAVASRTKLSVHMCVCVCVRESCFVFVFDVL